jgi:uncharacterized DUF497 family protein
VTLDIAELEVDDGNEAEMAKHGVSAREIFQLLDSRIVVMRNKKSRAADYQMIGQTHGGRVLIAPIVASAVEGRWRPITARNATKPEKARYEKG